MKIRFSLGWAGGNIARSFKSADAYALFQEYAARLDKFDGCTVSGPETAKKSGTVLWLCHTAKNAKMLSSEELAGKIQKLRDSSVRELCIAVGPADGFSAKDVESLKPDFLWSFGPLTLPHELAAVVAAEQVYRAFTIIRGLPYHSGH